MKDNSKFKNIINVDDVSRVHTHSGRSRCLSPPGQSALGPASGVVLERLQSVIPPSQLYAPVCT